MGSPAMTDHAWGSLRKPDEPPAPTLEEWLKRVTARQHSPDGAPMPSRRQAEREAPDWSGPMIRRHTDQEGQRD